MEATILFVAVAALILLAVTSMRYGVDSREGSASKERGTCVNTLPVTGVMTSKYSPPTGGTHRPPMKLS